MQTFAPYPNPEQSAGILDTKRLGKQIVECRQIAKAIADPGYGWQRHPVVDMWRSNSIALMHYAAHMAAEWEIRRGRVHGAYWNMLEDYGVTYAQSAHLALTEPYEVPYPWWWGDSRVHDSHKANLLRKDPVHYIRFSGEVAQSSGYYWPRRAE